MAWPCLAQAGKAWDPEWRRVACRQGLRGATVVEVPKAPVAMAVVVPVGVAAPAAVPAEAVVVQAAVPAAAETVEVEAVAVRLHFINK